MAAKKTTRARRTRSVSAQQTKAAAAGALLAERLPAERGRLFQAAAIVDLCRYACASKLEAFDPEQLIDALRTVYILIDGVADALSEDSLRPVARG